jgi:phenylacetaldehyde dehydrogenase
MALPLSIELLRYYAGWVTKLDGKTIPAAPGAAQGAPTLTYTRREAVGVVAQIIPWNFPLRLALLKTTPALAAGCPIVLKPAELAPLTALYLGRLANDAGLPEGVLNIVNGYAATVGARLPAHCGVERSPSPLRQR